MLAVVLALATALAYGVANYLGPLLGRRLPLAGVLLGGQCAGLITALLIYVVDNGGANDRAGLLLGLAAGAANAVALAGFYLAARIGELSVVAPIGSCGAVIPVLVALATGERPAALQLAGVPVAVIGIGLAARRPAQVATAPARSAAPLAGRPASAGIGYALLGAAGFGTFLSVSAHAAGHGPSWAVLWSRVALVGCTAGAVLVGRLPVAVPLRDLPAVLLPGLLLVLGTTAYAIATQHGLLSVVSVLATLNTVVTVGLALLLLGERLGRVQWAGVAVALGGVILLAAG